MGFAKAQFPRQARVFDTSPRASASSSVVSRYHDVFCVTLPVLFKMLLSDYFIFHSSFIEKRSDQVSLKQAHKEIQTTTNKNSKHTNKQAKQGSKY